MENEDREYVASKKEIACLVVSIVAFIGAIVAILLQLDTLLVICIAIHAIADILLILFIINKKQDLEGLTDLNIKPTVGWLEEKDALEREKGEVVNKLESTTASLDELKLENQTLKSEAIESEKQIEELKSRITAMEAAKVEEAESETTKMAELSILPPSNGRKETLNIADIARDAVSELAAAAQKAEVEIHFNPITEDLLVKAEADRIKILFRNIIDNSIKYMGSAGTLVITISSLEDMIFIILKDNGLGLPSDEVKHIFELNYQGSNRISGNGLGLTQAKAIVDYYGGNIYAKSTEKGGMGIYIQLPTN